MRRAGIPFLALLLAIPLASAAPVEVALPGSLVVSSSVLLAGSVSAPDATWDAVVFVGATEARFGPGTLTVCPRGADGATLQEVLRQASQDCSGAIAHADPAVRFGPATDALFLGPLPISRWPNASIVGFYGSNTTAIVPSAEGMGLAREEDAFRFGPATPSASVEVEDAQGITYYNGTGFVFLHDAEETQVLADGVVGGMPATRVSVGQADREALDEAMRPFTLLELQGAALGPDAREPRANVSGLFLEFGRVPSFVNGAMLGRINGTVGGVGFGNETALVRGTFTLDRDEGTLSGEVEPTVLIAEQGVAFGGRAVREPPWILVAILWGVAIVVLAIRRRTPARTRLQRWTWALAPLLAIAVADLGVLLARFGTSAFQELRDGSGTRAVLSLAVFELTLVALSFLLVVLPIRVVARRTLGPKVRAFADLALALAWLLVLVLAPAAFFALTHAVARL